ncbi:hypothetical protein ALQ37_200147 [Pseudomonas syringae pv. aptata]|uniref:Uncharacterized protein n=1 Tax=Pseudomonas syringae pv. aptata TaxID=83167 RepID=A0A3M3X616_PSEAP|nr:hypothetical protein [Pseudomonas syringae]RMO65406.1 hypothetical protein ALQ37_200147 [Pseudomonas syringae pv. aptata]
MSKSIGFLKDLIDAFKLERKMSVEITHLNSKSLVSMHHRIGFMHNLGEPEPLTIVVKDLEGFFKFVLREHGNSLRIAYTNKNKRHDSADIAENDTQQFIIDGESFSSHVSKHVSKKDDRIFELRCESCVIRIHVKVTSECPRETTYNRIRGLISDMLQRMEYYQVQVEFKNKKNCSVKFMHGMRDNGMQGRDITSVFFTNEDTDSDDDCPVRQYISLRTVEEGEAYKIQLNVLPDFSVPDAIDAERFKFVADNIIEEFTEKGNSVLFDNEEYRLKFSIQYDKPTPNCEKAIVQRFQ